MRILYELLFFYKHAFYDTCILIKALLTRVILILNFLRMQQFFSLAVKKKGRTKRRKPVGPFS